MSGSRAHAGLAWVLTGGLPIGRFSLRLHRLSSAAVAGMSSAPQFSGLQCSGLTAAGQRIYKCPLTDSCSHTFPHLRGLQLHWKSAHERRHGTLCSFSSTVEEAAAPETLARSSEPLPDLVSTAMSHLNEMTFRFYETEAEKGRAKQLLSTCMQSLKPHLVSSLGPLVHPEVDLPELIDPLLRTFDKINNSRRSHPPRPHPPPPTPPPPPDPW